MGFWRGGWVDSGILQIQYIRDDLVIDIMEAYIFKINMIIEFLDEGFGEFLIYKNIIPRDFIFIFFDERFRKFLILRYIIQI